MRGKALAAIMTLTVGGSLVLSSCAVVTKSTEASTETFQNTTDVSTDFTSSTSERDKDKADMQRVNAYARVNLDRLREDMARGGGEHLAAFSHLLGINDAHQVEFFALAKGRYAVLFGSEPTTAPQMVARLTTELDHYPGWRQ